jgi:outer membrane receptor protein involved in Fe transport
LRDKEGDTSVKANFLISCAVAALVGGSSTAVLAADVSDKPAAEAGGDADSNTIIVTAQRRRESIQDVPMTLQAISGEQLSKFNSTTFDDILKYTPNVTYGGNGPGAGIIFMRGLSAGVVGNQSSATIAPFPNTALYLDDQSMQFPARNADVYLADMERVEVLEGPQGTLFGGGAEAGAVRYITNKPKIDKFEGKFEGQFGGTAHGLPNGAFNAAINLPVVEDKLAVRAVVFAERQGGYIDNVESNFTRNNNDAGNTYFNLKPTNGLCPNGLPAGSAGLCALPNAQLANGGQYSNRQIAGKDINPATWTGGRISALWNITEDWNLLIAESFQDLDAQGSFAQQDTSLDFAPLKSLQTTIFSPAYNKDRFWNHAWTVNGKLSDFSIVYTGAYMVRHITTQQDYTNYSRTKAGMYYACTGGSTGWGSATPFCYSPVGYWHDKVRNTHMSHEIRITSPQEKRIRAIVGGYYERFRIYDVMNFHYKSIPSCTPQNLTAALAGGPVCVANVRTAPGSTANDPGIRDDTTAFGEDTQRGYDQTAAFASVDFDILPNLTITGGTRYYHYKEFEVGSQYQTGTDCLNVPNGGCLGNGGDVNIDAAHDRVTYHGFKSRAVITWKPRQGTMVYALFSQGFRPGGFNRATKLILPDPLPPHAPQFLRPNGYAPDSLNNYELGVKTDLFDHRVQLNLSGYFMEWKNTQIGFYNPSAGFGNTTFVTNGPTYHIKGFELQFVARPVLGLSLQGALTYNDNKQTNSPCFISNVTGSSTFGKCITQQFSGGAVVPVLNPFGAPGGVTPFTPKVQADFRARYDWEMKGYNWFVSGGVAYTGSMYNQPSTYPSGDGVLIPGTTQLRYKQPAYTTLDASIGLSKDFWTVSIFGKNLTDSSASTFTSSAQYVKAEVPLRPLTYGLKVELAF